jgi:hypothetical protein
MSPFVYQDAQFALDAAAIRCLVGRKTVFIDQLPDHRVALDLDAEDGTSLALASAKSGLTDSTDGGHGGEFYYNFGASGVTRY